MKHLTQAVMLVLPMLVGHEGIRYEPYDDGFGTATYCVGETTNVEDRTYTRQECLDLLEQRVTHDFEIPLKRCVTHWDALSAKTQAALLDWAYQFGTSAACSSDAVVGNINNGDIKAGCDGLLLWDKVRVHGRLKYVESIHNRRIDNRQMCLAGIS